MKVRLGKGVSVIVGHKEWYPGEIRDIHPGVFEGLKKRYPGRFVEVGGQPAAVSGEELSVPGVPPGEQIEGQGLPAAVDLALEVPPSPQPSPSEREGDREVKNVDDAGGADKPAGGKRAGTRRRAKR